MEKVRILRKYLLFQESQKTTQRNLSCLQRNLSNNFSESKSRIAKKHAVLVDKKIQRYAIDGNEKKFAIAIGGTHIPGNGPVDVVVSLKGKRYGIEVKTMAVNGNDKITMKKDAMERKSLWEKENKASVHTVVIDDTDTYNANGSGRHDARKRRYYHKVGYGSFRIGSMTRANTIEELKSFISGKTPTVNAGGGCGVGSGGFQPGNTCARGGGGAVFGPGGSKIAIGDKVSIPAGTKLVKRNDPIVGKTVKVVGKNKTGNLIVEYKGNKYVVKPSKTKKIGGDKTDPDKPKPKPKPTKKKKIEPDEIKVTGKKGRMTLKEKKESHAKPRVEVTETTMNRIRKDEHLTTVHSKLMEIRDHSPEGKRIKEIDKELEPLKVKKKEIQEKIATAKKNWPDESGNRFFGSDKYKSLDKEYDEVFWKINKLTGEKTKNLNKQNKEAKKILDVPLDLRRNINVKNIDAPTAKTKASTKFIQDINAKGAHDQGDMNMTIRKSTEDRSQYHGQGNKSGRIGMARGADTKVFVHEMAHGIEDQSRGNLQMAQAFVRSRTRDTPNFSMKERFGKGYAESEIGNEDHFGKVFKGTGEAAYAGKLYGRHATEIVSMGSEVLFKNPVHLATQDPDLFKLVVGVHHGRFN